MPATDARLQAAIQCEIDHLTRALQRHRHAPHSGSPAVLRAYHVLLERAYRRLDELEHGARQP